MSSNFTEEIELLKLVRVGEGRVDSQFHGPIQVAVSTPGKVQFTHKDKDYLLHRTKSNKNWLIRRVK